MAEFTDDADLEKLYEHRMKELKQAMEEKQRLKTRGHGQLTEIEEKEFLDTVTQTSKVVVHFFHRDF